MSAERERVFITFTKAHLDILDNLVKAGLFLDRQIAIRSGVRLLAKEYGISPFCQEADEQ